MAIEIAPQKRELRPERRARRGLNMLLHLCGWGGAAALALTALALTVQTDAGRERLRQAYIAGMSVAGAPAAPPKAPEKDAQTLALEAQLRALTADRDGLAARMASLERHLEDVTGSIQRQAAQTLAPQPAPAPAVPQAVASAPPPAPAVPQAVASAPPPAPAVPQAVASAPPPAPAAPQAVASAPPAAVAVASATPASAAAPVTVASVAPAAPLPKPIDPLAMPLILDSGAGWPAAEEPEAVLPREPDGPQAAVPLPPARFIAAPPEPAAPPRAEFGIELASAANMDALRARWTAVKANHGPLLAGLQPIAVRERRAGGTDYKLVAGPLPTLSSARELCARFAGARANCRPARINADNVVQH
ncbi:MAG: hypothetical protein ACK4UO_03345 [Pseudolabrys sp.]